MDDLSTFCCVNCSCPDHRKRGAGNLTVTARYGKDRRRMLRCRTCTMRFSERHGTVFFNAHMPDEKVIWILQHITEGCGVRQTHRLTGTCQNRETKTGQVQYLMSNINTLTIYILL